MDGVPLGNGPLGRAIERLAIGLAAIGGLILLALAALTVVNIGLRVGFGFQLRGEFDLASLGGAVAVFCFLPYGQVSGAHVTIDFITKGAPERVKAWLDALASLAFALAVAILAWRMAVGGMELATARQETAVLRLPYWAAFVAAAPAMALLLVACAHDAWRRLRRVGA
ncbi:MAG: TRAP transporter small permease [Alphaproteobacteria bacterium]|nr:TRAP transporter small permease [Alphaproteobacteria bacterium]